MLQARQRNLFRKERGKIRQEVIKTNDAKSDSQSEERRSFSCTSKVWEPLPDTIKSAWNFHVNNKALTDNAQFSMSNLM